MTTKEPRQRAVNISERSAIENSLARGLEYLVAAFDANSFYGHKPTARSRILFHNGAGRDDLPMRTKSGLSAGIVFEYSLALEAVLNARDAGAQVPAGCVQNAVSTLYGLGDSTGWRYYPEYPMLPYDADDFAQVLRVLLIAGPNYCNWTVLDPILELVLASTWPNGAVNTWLVRDETERMFYNLLLARGRDGTGQDVEVVANLSLSLLTLADCRGNTEWSEYVGTATGWLARQQHDFGFWRPSWYVGCHYSTYLAARLLSRVGGYGENLARARSWVEDAAPSDVLNSALYLLTMTDMDLAPGAWSTVLITESQREDGGWDTIPFVDTHARVWGSRNVTTAFCVRALLAQSVAAQHTNSHTP